VGVVTDWLIPDELKVVHPRRYKTFQWPEGCNAKCRDRDGNGCGACDDFLINFQVAARELAERCAQDADVLAETFLVDTTSDRFTRMLCAKALARDCANDEVLREAVAGQLLEDASYMLLAANTWFSQYEAQDCA
jgi:hypothetical protein